MKDLSWNEVLIQRVSPKWCDSWGPNVEDIKHELFEDIKGALMVSHCYDQTKDCSPGLQKLQRKLSWGSCVATTTITTTPGSITTVTTCITVVSDQELFDVASFNGSNLFCALHG